MDLTALAIYYKRPVYLLFSLLLLTVSGIALLVLPKELLVAPPGLSAEGGVYSLWYNSLVLFAVPLCGIVLSMSKSKWVRFSAFMWGLWLLILTVWVLIHSVELPQNSTFGTVYMGWILAITTSLCMASMASLVKPRKKKK